MAFAVTIVAVLAYVAIRWLHRASLERFGLAFAAVAYLPASNVLAGRRWVADSYLYLPLVGLAIATSSFAARVWPTGQKKLGWTVALFAFADLALLAHVQSSTWSSSVDLWTPVYERYPNHAEAMAALAGAYDWEGRTDEAIRAYVAIEERFPDYADTRDDEARARMALGEPERARALIERGIDERNPGCIRQFWQALLASPGLPPMGQRDIAAKAFDAGFEAMKSGLHHPQEFYRVAAILVDLELDGRAAAARDHAHALEMGDSR
jgi:tetratricopeptide (TPR) repeat protein